MGKPPTRSSWTIDAFAPDELSDYDKELLAPPASAGATISVFIKLPAPILPIERGERFEEPIKAVLGDLGSVVGGGTLALPSARGAISFANIELELVVSRFDHALAIVSDVLRQQGAPRGTTFSYDGRKTPLFP